MINHKKIVFKRSGRNFQFFFQFSGIRSDTQFCNSVMKEFLCDDGAENCEGEMDPEPLLRYFKPIRDWLEEDQKNKKWNVGWEMESKWKPCDYNKVRDVHRLTMVKCELHFHKLW